LKISIFLTQVDDLRKNTSGFRKTPKTVYKMDHYGYTTILTNSEYELTKMTDFAKYSNSCK